MLARTACLPIQQDHRFQSCPHRPDYFAIVGRMHLGGPASLQTRQAAPPRRASILTEFLQKLTRRGSRDAKLAISGAYESVETAACKVLNTTWQWRRVHLARNAVAHASKSGRRIASAFIATAFALETPEASSTRWRTVADKIRPEMPKGIRIVLCQDFLIRDPGLRCRIIGNIFLKPIDCQSCTQSVPQYFQHNG